MSVLVTVLLLRKDAMTKATLVKEQFYWGLLRFSQTESIIVRAGSMVAHMALK